MKTYPFYVWKTFYLEMPSVLARLMPSFVLLKTRKRLRRNAAHIHPLIHLQYRSLRQLLPCLHFADLVRFQYSYHPFCFLHLFR